MNMSWLRARRIPATETQRERRHELKQALAEHLSLGERDAIADHAEHDGKGDVRRVGDRPRGLVDEHVAGDAAAEAAQQRHAHHPDDREVLVVIGAAGEQRPVQRVRRRSDQVDGREMTGELPAGEPVHDYRARCEVQDHRRATATSQPGRSSAAQSHTAPMWRQGRGHGIGPGSSPQRPA